MKNHCRLAVLFLFVLSAFSCSHDTKFQFPLVQKYNVQGGDVFYFRPRDGQFVLVERRKALAVAIAADPTIQAFSYNDRITVNRPQTDGKMLENKTFLEKVNPQPVLAMSADGHFLAGGDTNGVVNVWNVATGDLEVQFNKPAAVQVLSFSPDNNSLAIGLAKSAGEVADTVWLYDVRAHSARRSFGSTAVQALAWSTDGSRFAAGLEDGSVLLVDASAFGEPQRIGLTTSPVIALAFHPSGFFLAAASADKRISFLKLPAGERIFTFEPLPPNPFFPRVIESMAFDQSGNRFAADYAEGDMRIWDSSVLGKSLAK